MAGLRFTELQSRPLEFLDFTSLTLEEFPQLVPPFETAFHARMAAWRMEGKPRTARQLSVDKHCVWSKYSHSLSHWRLHLYHRPSIGLPCAPLSRILTANRNGKGCGGEWTWTGNNYWRI